VLNIFYAEKALLTYFGDVICGRGVVQRVCILFIRGNNIGRKWWITILV